MFLSRTLAHALSLAERRPPRAYPRKLPTKLSWAPEARNPEIRKANIVGRTFQLSQDEWGCVGIPLNLAFTCPHWFNRLSTAQLGSRLVASN